MTILLPATIVPANAASGDRTIYLYYTHTKETRKITFRRNGRYDKKALAELNYMLRDWRRNEPTKMDPALFDLVWEVYKESGATGPIHVVSAYRSPKTNEMLRSRSRAVAKNSRHTMGMAMDFFIPGVSVSKLRKIALRKQVGGVGYYPTSGNPFVHLDTGNVRAWPRMTRAQLKKVFPKGKTLHVPTDGVPLSKSGYKYAKAQWVKCHSVPCSGRTVSAPTIRVANDASKNDSSGSGGTLLDWIFGSDESTDDGEATIALASNGPSQRSVASIPVSAPTPMQRPLLPGTLVANAPFPAARPRALITTSAPQPALFSGQPGTIAVASANVPAPRILMTQPIDGQSNPLLTAYAPTIAPEPDAQRAVQMLIERRRNAAIAPTTPAPKLAPAAPVIATDDFRTASVGDKSVLDALGSLIENTWTAVSSSGDPTKAPQIDSAALNIEMRAGKLFAPDFDHITEIFIDPALMTSRRYAVIFEHDEADFDPAAELGRSIGHAGFNADSAWGLDTNRFIARAPLLVASR